VLRLNFGRTQPVTFEPGEVKVFSVTPDETGEIYLDSAIHGNLASPQNMNQLKNRIDATPGWNPNGYSVFSNSHVGERGQIRYNPASGINQKRANILTERDGGSIRFSLAMAPDDEIEFTIIPENVDQRISHTGTPIGSAMSFWMAQRNYASEGTGSSNANHRGYGMINLQNQSFVTRYGRDDNLPQEFNQNILTQGLPGGVFPLTFEPIRAETIANATNAGESMPFFQFALSAACETSELANGGIAAGRRYPSRPFLHSSPIQSVFVDRDDDTAPYNHGWSWRIDEMNSVLEALVQETQSGNGFYGGGYTSENGTTHVVQQEIPVTPPISIAALSHARIGGFTLASEAPAAEGFTALANMQTVGVPDNVGSLADPSGTLGFQRTTALGQGGLYPHVLQAIGNSYANPNLAAGVAFNPAWTRIYDQSAPPRNVTFADHSYLANKALWDQFFFSSITPQPSSVNIFGGSGRDAEQVASDFFFDSNPLPNRRIVPYLNNLDADALNEMFNEKDEFADGLADKIASHLMVEGPFNINSTSVEAWRIFFSSLKGKPIAYLDGGSNPQEVDTGSDVPITMGALPAGLPASTAGTSDPRSPEQWRGMRLITEDEIDALSQAMVREVKRRGPFLSLSEFVNRRLDPSNTDGTALKGALQAALDYDGSEGGPEVSINQNFRQGGRTLDSEVGGIGFAFPAAAEGPAAYGSSAYVDQADVLRQFAGQLTPRGDTFVIRTYGDALDRNGNITARAWCEAIVQRTPDYVDAADDNHFKTADLLSDANRRFGRSFQIVSFRWLNASEI